MSRQVGIRVKNGGSSLAKFGIFLAQIAPINHYVFGMSRQVGIRRKNSGSSLAKFCIFLAQIAPTYHFGIGSLGKRKPVGRMVTNLPPRLAFFRRAQYQFGAVG